MLIPWRSELIVISTVPTSELTTVLTLGITVFLKVVVRELQDSRTRGGTEHFFKRLTGITLPYLKYVTVINPC
jgi:F0F1-type ATP synthase membrane subunit a